MNKITKCSAIGVGIIGIGLPGCASYKAVSLPDLQPDFAPYSETVDGVTLAVKTFSHQDSKRYFDRDVITAGYIPIHVTVYNNTKGYVLFSEQGIGIPTVPPQHVADQVHTSTAGRIAGYTAGALILWPLLVPAIVDGVGSARANEQLDRDFDAKAAQQVTIQPFARHNGVIFVPTSDYQRSFRITMVEKDSRERLEFQVGALPPPPEPVQLDDF